MSQFTDDYLAMLAQCYPIDTNVLRRNLAAAELSIFIGHQQYEQTVAAWAKEKQTLQELAREAQERADRRAVKVEKAEAQLKELAGSLRIAAQTIQEAMPLWPGSRNVRKHVSGEVETWQAQAQAVLHPKED